MQDGVEERDVRFGAERHTVVRVAHVFKIGGGLQHEAQVAPPSMRACFGAAGRDYR